MTLFENIENFYFAFFHVFGAMLLLLLIAFFVLFHFKHVREYQRLAAYLHSHTRGVPAQNPLTLIFGTEKLIHHKDKKISAMARNCRKYMIHQIVLAFAFAIFYGVLTLLRMHIWS